MKWYVADKEYVNYLKTVDSKVQDIEYDNSLKPYLGILITVEGFNYYVPISSADKPWKVSKYSKMKNSNDFHKIIDSTDGKLLAVLNINNMIPIPDEYLTKLMYCDIEKYRSFASEKEKQTYVDLLRKELKEISSIKEMLAKKAGKLYKHKIEKPYTKLSQRCCDFKLLEEHIGKFKATE